MMKAIEEKSVDAMASEMGNVFESLELDAYAPAFHLIASLNTMPGVLKAMLAGAGPTVVVLCDSDKTASQIIQPFRMQGWVAFSTHSV